MVAYCFKCRNTRDIKDPLPVTLKNGRAATTGVCAMCGAKVFRIQRNDSRSSKAPVYSAG